MDGNYLVNDDQNRTEDILEHYGVKGMRWGIRKDRRAARVAARMEKARKKKFKDIQKEREKKEEAKKAAKEEKKQNERIRKKLMKSRDPAYVYKNAHLLTDQELQQRLNRLKNESELKRLAGKKKSKGEAYVDNFIKWGTKANAVYKVMNSDLGKAIQKKMEGN